MLGDPYENRTRVFAVNPLCRLFSTAVARMKGESGSYGINELAGRGQSFTSPQRGFAQAVGG